MCVKDIFTGTAGLPFVSLVGGSLRFEFLRRKGAAMTYTPQKSGTASGWQPLTATPSVTSIDTAWERVIILEPLAAPLDARAIGRVLVTQP